ncbi:MAG: glycosyltransferase family 2 protein [Pseudomonadota bacterium]
MDDTSQADTAAKAPEGFSGGVSQPDPARAPLLSVVIPAYNAEKFLAETIASLQDQTIDELEIVIVNDGSRDGTAEAIAALEKEPGRFPVRGVHQANAGPSAARNTGIEAARGRYIGFLDADDRWHANKAARQIALMEADPSIAMTCSGWQIIDEEGRVLNRTGGGPTGRFSFVSLLFDNPVGTTSSVIIRADVFEAVGLFDTQLKYCEDLELWLRIAEREEWRVENIGEPLIDRRERAGQLTLNFEAIKTGWNEVLRRALEWAPDRVGPVAREARAYHDRYTAFLAYNAKDYGAARRYTVSAWKTAPLAMLKNPKALPTTIASLLSILPGPVHRVLDSRLRAIRER